MSVPGFRASPPVRRWAGLLLLSVVFHAALLGGLALRLPMAPRVIVIGAPEIDLVRAPPLVRLPTSRAAAPAPALQSRLVVLDTRPRYAEMAQAATGDASDAVDLFGPVFADGMWPRPAILGTVSCDAEAERERAEACRRELMLVGLASDAPARSNAQP
jgi:hypothetical protein